MNHHIPRLVLVAQIKLLGLRYVNNVWFLKICFKLVHGRNDNVLAAR